MKKLGTLFQKQNQFATWPHNFFSFTHFVVHLCSALPLCFLVLVLLCVLLLLCSSMLHYSLVFCYSYVPSCFTTPLCFIVLMFLCTSLFMYFFVFHYFFVFCYLCVPTNFGALLCFTTPFCFANHVIFQLLLLLGFHYPCATPNCVIPLCFTIHAFLHILLIPWVLLLLCSSELHYSCVLCVLSLSCVVDPFCFVFLII